MKRCFVFRNFKIKYKVTTEKRTNSGTNELGNYNSTLGVLKFCSYGKRTEICIHRCIYTMNVLCITMKTKYFRFKNSNTRNSCG